jgi:hypothetical protein
MNFGDSVQDASRSDPDVGILPAAVGGDGDSHQARSQRTQRPLQDIQDLIDKLAAVTQQLRHPGRRSEQRAPESLTLDRESPQQACAVGGTEGSRAE